MHEEFWWGILLENGHLEDREMGLVGGFGIRGVEASGLV
jgi:hypothetical protein